MLCLQQNTICWKGTHSNSQNPGRDQGGSGSTTSEKLSEMDAVGEGHLHIQAAPSPRNEHVHMKLGGKDYGGWGGAEGERTNDRSDRNTALKMI